MKNIQPKAGADVNSTSLSVELDYSQVCLQAAYDNSIFETFRSVPAYNEVLEHVSRDYGDQYLELVRHDKKVMSAFREFQKNDLYGSPRMFDFPGVGSMSPTTIRYVKVLLDLLTEFKSLDGMQICEIGVGYGGQCRIIDVLTKPTSYCLVDIVPALLLTRRYLDRYILDSILEYKTSNELHINRYDLVISNYAFTELSRELQDVYLKKVILNSERGYITYNEITPSHYRSYSLDELLEIIPGARFIAEKPLTHPKNCIILWGDGLDNATQTLSV